MKSLLLLFLALLVVFTVEARVEKVTDIEDYSDVDSEDEWVTDSDDDMITHSGESEHDSDFETVDDESETEVDIEEVKRPTKRQVASPVKTQEVKTKRATKRKASSKGAVRQAAPAAPKLPRSKQMRKKPKQQKATEPEVAAPQVQQAPAAPESPAPETSAPKQVKIDTVALDAILNDLPKGNNAPVDTAVVASKSKPLVGPYTTGFLAIAAGALALPDKVVPVLASYFVAYVAWFFMAKTGALVVGQVAKSVVLPVTAVLGFIPIAAVLLHNVQLPYSLLTCLVIGAVLYEAVKNYGDRLLAKAVESTDGKISGVVHELGKQVVYGIGSVINGAVGKLVGH